MGTLWSLVFLSPNTEKYITSMIDSKNATFTSFNGNLQPAQFHQSWFEDPWPAICFIGPPALSTTSVAARGSDLKYNWPWLSTAHIDAEPEKFLKQKDHCECNQTFGSRNNGNFGFTLLFHIPLKNKLSIFDAHALHSSKGTHSCCIYMLLSFQRFSWSDIENMNSL